MLDRKAGSGLQTKKRETGFRRKLMLRIECGVQRCIEIGSRIQRQSPGNAEHDLRLCRMTSGRFGCKLGIPGLDWVVVGMDQGGRSEILRLCGWKKMNWARTAAANVSVTASIAKLEFGPLPRAESQANKRFVISKVP